MAFESAPKRYLDAESCKIIKSLSNAPGFGCVTVFSFEPPSHLPRWCVGADYGRGGAGGGASARDCFFIPLVLNFRRLTDDVRGTGTPCHGFKNDSNLSL